LEEVYGRRQIPEWQSAVNQKVLPGPDTTIVLGFVKDAAHWAWIDEYKVYNVRGSGRPGGVAPNAEFLFSQLLLLYCPDEDKVQLARIVSGPEFFEKNAMKGTNYPNPSGDYVCVQISLIANTEVRAPCRADQIVKLVARLGKLYGEPTAVRWVDLENID
jgi:hypothetical protein